MDTDPQAFEKLDTGTGAEHEGLGPFPLVRKLTFLVSESRADAQAEIGIEAAVREKVEVRDDQGRSLPEPGIRAIGLSGRAVGSSPERGG